MRTRRWHHVAFVVGRIDLKVMLLYQDAMGTSDSTFSIGIDLDQKKRMNASQR